MNPNAVRSANLGVAGALILGVLTGCFSLGRTSPALERYVIGGAHPTDTVAPVAALDGVAVGVRRLDLADYLGAPSIVVRRGAHEVLKSDFHRWGEDPADGINRAFARHLAGRASFRTVDVAPWPVRSSYDYLIQLHVTRFEGRVPAGSSPAGRAKEGAAHVRASWEIVRWQDGAVLVRGVTDHREEGWRLGDYAALVALLDEGLAVVSRDVAVALEALVAGEPGDSRPAAGQGAGGPR
jgi:uncharacterized lipoprotein YmbA